MRLAIDIARFTAWVSLTVLFCALAWVAIGMRSVPAHVNAVLAHTTGVLLRAEGVESKMNASAVNLDRATGAWADSARLQAESVDGLVRDARRTLRTANAQMAHVAPVLDAAAATIAGVGQDAHRMSMDTSVVLGTADNTLRAARPVLTEAAQTERDVDAFVTAPELKATLASVEQTSANVAAGSAEATAILRDGRKEADALMAPKPWYRRMWSDTLKVGELVWDFAR